MTPRLLTQRIAPWTGLFLGAGAWFADQQLSSDVNVWDCTVGGGAWAVGVGVVCALIALAGALVSWRARSRGVDSDPQSQRFAGVVGAAAAVIFTLAIAFGVLAGLLLPSCQR